MTNKVNFGLLIVSPEGENKNIGDYIQSIAQRQFLPRVDDNIQREKLSSYKNDSKTPVALIMNAWYMWHPENWPPSDLIIPFPVSIHLSPIGSEKMLLPKGIEWFKRYEPIGCRDYDTMETLKKKGINSYFSACLTLTLGKTYHSLKKREGICFVNPYIPRVKGLRDNILVLLHSLKNPRTIISLLVHNYNFFSCSWNMSVHDRKYSRIKAFIRASYFHWIYSQKFTNSLLRNATYINHTVNTDVYSTDEALFDYADNLLKKYASFKYMVTSRIHAALPCLGMGTPVIFVQHPDIVGEKFNSKRISGLVDFFHSIKISGFHNVISDEVFNTSKLLDDGFQFENKTTWMEYADDLTKKCESFVRKCLEL